MAPEALDADPCPLAGPMGVAVTRTDPDGLEAALAVREDLRTSGNVLSQ